jgi:hypothetical protein
LSSAAFAHVLCRGDEGKKDGEMRQRQDEDIAREGSAIGKAHPRIGR